MEWLHHEYIVERNDVNIRLEDPLLTTAEFAEIARISTQHAIRLRREGKGPRYYQIAARGRCTYRASDIEAWLKRKRKTPTASAALAEQS